MGFSVPGNPRISGRLCPTCGRTGDARYCPIDGSPTFFFAGDLAHQGPVALGERVGSYIVHTPIGRGGHATVYRAERAQGLGDVAVKVLHVDRADPQCVSRFYREALIGARLSHPNTVRVLDVGQADSGAIFLAMEFLRGKTWDARLLELEANDERMAPEEAIAIAAEVLRGLAEAHDQGVVHRDLKPSNVMLAEAGGEPFVKIMDFGVAHVLFSGLTEDGRAIGTPAYMSPEQCCGGALDGRSDLYAVAMALYRSVTGRLPFAESSTLGLMYAQTNLPPTDITAVAPQPLPPGLATVIMRGLAKAPEDRFVDARAMRKALEDVLSGHAVDVDRPAVSSRSLRTGRPADQTPEQAVPSQASASQRALQLPRAARVAATLAATGVVAWALLAFAARPREEQTVATVARPASAVASPSPATPPPAVAVPAPAVAAAATPAPSVSAAPEDTAPPPVAAARPPKPKLAHAHRRHAPTAPVLPP